MTDSSATAAVTDIPPVLAAMTADFDADLTAASVRGLLRTAPFVRLLVLTSANHVQPSVVKAGRELEEEFPGRFVYVPLPHVLNCARQCNAVFAQALFPCFGWGMRVDNDVVFSPGWWKPMAGLLQRPGEIGCCYPKVTNRWADGREVVQRVHSRPNTETFLMVDCTGCGDLASKWTGTHDSADCIFTAAFLSREAIMRIGYIDEFMAPIYFDDIEMGIRISTVMPVKCCCDASVVHLGPSRTIRRHRKQGGGDWLAGDTAAKRKRIAQRYVVSSDRQRYLWRSGKTVFLNHNPYPDEAKLFQRVREAATAVARECAGRPL